MGGDEIKAHLNYKNGGYDYDFDPYKVSYGEWMAVSVVFTDTTDKYHIWNDNESDDRKEYDRDYHDFEGNPVPNKWDQFTMCPNLNGTQINDS